MTLRLEIMVVPDADGFGGALALKGDWLFVKISDASCVGWGEATHSGNDKRCMEVLGRLFDQHVKDMDVSLEGIRRLERAAFSEAPDFLTATAISAIDQALYDLLARKGGIPVWRLFRPTAIRENLPVYVTINRALTDRTLDDYRAVLSLVRSSGFGQFKCAPFERVESTGDQIAQGQGGLATLRTIASEFGELGFRVDFHKRFSQKAFLQILPAIDALKPHWIEEPSPLGPEYLEIKSRARCLLAAGELYFSAEGFRPIVAGKWADVIMPDVKHVGGFGPMLEVCRLAEKNNLEVSPHCPSGAISAMASLHAAAVCPNVTSLELPFARGGIRAELAELLDGDRIFLPDAPGWGIEVR